MRLIDDALCGLSIETRQADVEARPQGISTFIEKKIYFRIDRPFAGKHDFPLAAAISIAPSKQAEDADENIERFIAHAQSRSMGPYLAVGRGVKGELAIRRGDAAGGIETIKSCLRELHDSGYELLTTTFNIAMVQGLLALGQIEQSARLTDDAIRLVEQSGDHLYMPELLRMKGKVGLSVPEPKAEQAEARFIQSLELSRRQGAKAWELRAAIDLAGLFAERERREEARRLLQTSLMGFAEGSDTADIRTAGALLTML